MRNRKLNISRLSIIVTLISTLWMLPTMTFAEVSLPALISDNMVLQQKTRAHLWGWAEPGERIRVSIAEREFRTTTRHDSSWAIYLPQLPVGQYTLKVDGRTVAGETSGATINNVAVGEVWLASGQSNMAWPVSKSSQPQQTIAGAQHPEIRFFKVTRNTALLPLKDVSGYWEVLTPETVGGVSAVAYHFASQLQHKLDAPVGVIEADWNNTKAQAWTNLEALEAEPALQPMLAEMHQQLNMTSEEQQAVDNKMLAWEADNYLADPGIAEDAKAFSEPDYDDSEWQSVSLPQTLGKMAFTGDGAAWFRREIILPASWAGQDVELKLGMIDDFDITYVNGVSVGVTTRDQPFHWLFERRYMLPKGILQAGRNVIAVRVFDQFGDGGFTSRPRSMKLKKGKDSFDLAGEWQYKFSYQAPAKQADFASIPQPPYGLKNRNTPGVLYNAMIAPLLPYTLQGVIWYQGESDAHTAGQYRVIFPLLIKQWRKSWQQQLPFLFVQLANFEFDAGATRQKWAEIREIQAFTDDTVPGTGMVTAIDVGEADNVHPKDKKTVGERLASWALARVYGLNVAYQGPDYDRHVLEDFPDGRQQVRLHFSAADGLHAKGDITAFELAGADGVYHPAEAVIDGAVIFVKSDKVAEPLSVRYAWRDNPAATIYNEDNLPLKPFLRRLVH